MSGTAPRAHLPEVGPTEALSLVRGGAHLLDVREVEEWVAGHAPDAHHLPMGQLAARLADVPSDRAVVCVCRVGGRSAVVASALIAEGREACNLAGGMQAWAGAGLPVVDEHGRLGRIV